MNKNTKRIVRQGVLFAVLMTAFNYWVNGGTLIIALIIGVVGGLVGVIANILLKYKLAVPKHVLDAMAVDLDTDEQINFQTPAKYTCGEEPISGKLLLTNKRFIFKGYQHGKKAQQFSVDLEDFKKADSFKTLGLFENGLRLHTTSGESHSFIVDKLKQWISLAESKKQVSNEFLKSTNSN